MFTRWVSASSDNERLSIWNGSMATVSMNIVNVYVAMYLLDALHATNGEVAKLNSLPNAVNLFAMVAAAALIGRAHSKKWFCVAATTVSRTFYLWIALVPLLPVHNPALWVVWLVALTRIPQSFGDLSWQALIGDLISTERRSAFFSERNRMMTLVGMVITLLAGFALQQFDTHLRWPYQVAFASTVVFAALEIWLLIRHDESVSIQQQAANAVQVGTLWGNARRAFQAVARDRQYVVVVCALLLFNFGWQMSWPLFNIFQIKTAHAPAFWLGLIAVANQVSQILTFRWWGRIADKYGNAKAMAWAAFGMAIAPVLTILSTNLYYLVFINFITGVAVAGTTLLLFNYLLEVSPADRRTSYIAYYNVALSVIGFIAPEVGIHMLDAFGMTTGMVVSSLLRVLGGVAFLAVAYWAAKYRGKRAYGERADLSV